MLRRDHKNDNTYEVNISSLAYHKSWKTPYFSDLCSTKLFIPPVARRSDMIDVERNDVRKLTIFSYFTVFANS